MNPEERGAVSGGGGGGGGGDRWVGWTWPLPVTHSFTHSFQKSGENAILVKEKNWEKEGLLDLKCV